VSVAGQRVLGSGEAAAILRSLRGAQGGGPRPRVGARENELVRRGYGSGSLSVRRDAGGQENWYGQWWSGGRHAMRKLGPKRQPGTRDGLTRVQAERELRRRIERDAAVVSRASRRTIAEAGTEYVDHLEHVMERKATTIKDYRGYVSGHFEPFFGARALDRIDEGWVSAYLTHKRERGLAAKTVNNHLNFMHGLFEHARKKGWAERNPVAAVDRPRKTSGRGSQRLRYLRPSELEAVIGAIPEDELGAVERPLYLAAAMTGLRQGELIALSWQDIDWLAGLLRVVDNFPRGRVEQADSPKSREGRSVPLAGPVAAALEEHSRRSEFRADSDLVFCHPHTGRALDPSKLRKRFRQALERARVRRVTFHELRHTFGTQLAAGGVPLRSIQEWMGHADAKTTEIYRHYAPDPTNGVQLVERAFAPYYNPYYILSETGGTEQQLNRSGMGKRPPTDPPPADS
jgi:integrase